MIACSFLCFIIKDAANFVFIRAILSTSVVFFTCTEVSCKYSSPQYTQIIFNIILCWSCHSCRVCCALPWKGIVIAAIDGSWLHLEKLHAQGSYWNSVSWAVVQWNFVRHMTWNTEGQNLYKSTVCLSLPHGFKYFTPAWLMWTEE